MINLTGNLGRRPESRFKNDGSRIVTFSMAVNGKNKETVWHQVAIVEGTHSKIDHQIVKDHLAKGSKVKLLGEFRSIPKIIKGKTTSSRIEFIVKGQEAIATIIDNPQTPLSILKVSD